MFIEKTVYLGYPNDLLPPRGVDWCDSSSPDGGRWLCTRPKGHEGTHLAAIGPCEYAAEWDDNRTTDPKTDLFVELGLEL